MDSTSKMILFVTITICLYKTVEQLLDYIYIIYSSKHSKKNDNIIVDKDFDINDKDLKR